MTCSSRACPIINAKFNAMLEKVMPFYNLHNSLENVLQTVPSPGISRFPARIAGRCDPAWCPKAPRFYPARFSTPRFTWPLGISLRPPILHTGPHGFDTAVSETRGGCYLPDTIAAAQRRTGCCTGRFIVYSDAVFAYSHLAVCTSNSRS